MSVDDAFLNQHLTQWLQSNHLPALGTPCTCMFAHGTLAYVGSYHFSPIDLSIYIYFLDKWIMHFNFFNGL